VWVWVLVVVVVREGGVGGQCGMVVARGRAKTSMITHFREVLVVVVAREGPNHQKRALTLVFGWYGWWQWPEEGPTTENERNRLVFGGGGQRKVRRPKTSMTARFWGGAGKRKAQPSKTSSRARFREVWVVVGTMWEVG